MNIITLDELKAHLRIDDDIEDDVLTLYGDAAEEFVLGYVHRSADELTALNEEYTGASEFPKSLKVAILMQAGNLYKNRETTTAQANNVVAMGMEALMRKWVNLQTEEDE